MPYRVANIASMETNPATGHAPLDVQLLWLPQAVPGNPHHLPPLSAGAMNPGANRERYAVRVRRPRRKVEQKAQRALAS